MKLSEKLAALEEQERKTTASTSKVRVRADGKGRRKSAPATGWATSKRKVRELVLAEVAPKMGGMSEVELMREVRGALDRAVQREDVKVSPMERRKFVDGYLCSTDPSSVRRRWLFGYDEGGVELVGFAIEFERDDPEKEKWIVRGVDKSPRDDCPEVAD